MQYDSREPIFVFGKLTSGQDVTIRLVRFPGDEELTLSDDVCHETQIPGYYVWDTSLLLEELPRYPERVTILYVMIDSLGHEFSGKLIVNDFPEEVRRTYSNVQTLM